MPAILLVLAAVGTWYFGLFSAFESYTYRAEVGYYDGERWKSCNST